MLGNCHYKQEKEVVLKNESSSLNKTFGVTKMRLRKGPIRLLLVLFLTSSRVLA